MKESYPIPQYVLDAYNSCEINWSAKQLKFPRAQFAKAASGHPEIQAWFDYITQETGLDLSPNNIFQICIRHHLTEYVPAKCPTCGKLLPISSVKIGVKYCSNRCAQLSPETIAKVKSTLIKNFGEAGRAAEAITNKKKETIKARYGSLEAFEQKKQEKIQQTNLEKYGVTNVYAAESIKEKIRQTNLTRLGVEIPTKSEVIKEKIKKTNQERYGGNAPICSSEVHNQIKQTLLKNYGVDVPAKSEVIKEKIKKTNQERYGGNAPICSSDIKAKIIQTNLEKYGVENPSSSSEIREKIKQTNQKRYGSNAPAAAESVKEKIKKTNLSRYGVEYVLQAQVVKDKSAETSRRRFFNSLLDILPSKNITVLSTEDDYAKYQLTLKCNRCGHIWLRNLKENPLHNGVRCLYCPKCYSFSSKGEKELVEYIKSIYHGQIIENDRSLIAPKELDIYLPEKRVALEFDGTYWHSDPIKPEGYHQQKSKACTKKHVRLIHVFEYDWVFNQDKVKSLINSALGIFEKRLYARNCVVKPIMPTEYRDFLLKYHLQDAINSRIKHGLYYQDELVSVIGFGQSRFKSDELELHRYCVKAGYQIIGGFSKLIKHVCKEQNIEEFISYVDFAHFAGRGYKKVGFELISLTRPSYFYIKGDQIKSRMQCQKHKLSAFLKSFSEELSESENMALNGWYKVYDCGNLKLKYSINE